MSEEFIAMDLSRTCRTCLTQDKDMHPINNSIKTAQNNNFIIKDMLMACAQIKIADDDGLPEQVCLKCVCRVSDAFFFKQNCEKSENTLQEYVSSKINDLSLQVVPSEEVPTNCEVFQNNVMNFINLPAEIKNGHDEILIKPAESLKNKDTANTNAPSCNSAKELDVNILQNQQLKRNRKRKKISRRFTCRSQKMVKIAPKQIISASALPYNDSRKFIAFNITGNNIKIGNEQAQLAKSDNIEVKDYCKICGIYFTDNHDLKTHKKNVHNLNDLTGLIKYMCSICNIEFSVYEKLYEHNLIKHYKENTPQCDLLEKHKSLVEDNVPGELSCDICPKKFDSARGLSIHKAFHNVKMAGNKICCKICDRTFNVMSNLTYHMKYHKSDVCQYCNHGFCNMSMMKAHMKEIHAENKPYHCSYCSKKFNIRKVLLRHKRIAHGIYNDIYFCGICRNTKVGFITHEFLVKHIEKYHKLPEINSELHCDSTTILKSDKECVSKPLHINRAFAASDELQNQTTYINMLNLPDKSSAVPDLSLNRDLTFEGSMCNGNLSQLIDLTNEVNTSHITLNDDGTINIAINDAQMQNIRVSEVSGDNSAQTQDFSLGQAIENTIKVLKQEMFNDNKNENSFSVTEIGEYTIDEINTDENNTEENINNLQDNGQKECAEQNLELSDSLMSGKVVDYDEEKQQYTISYEGADYIISAASLNQANNLYFEVPETVIYNNNLDSNSKDKCDETDAKEQFECNDDGDETNLLCNFCNITFIDQTSYNDHVPKHNEAAKNLENLVTLRESAVENSTDIKEGMIRININETTGFVEHEKTDLIFAKQDYIIVSSEANKVDVPRYRCPKCDDLFTRQYSLNRHLAHTHNEMCLVCNTCGEGFNRVSMLEQHRLKHKNMLNVGVIITSLDKPHVATNDQSEETQNALQEITESLYVYEPENQSFPCEFCDKTFQRQIYLERHRLVHLGINQPGFMCSICNKIFLTSIDMQKHKRKHNEEYLQCNLCDRTFTTLGGLKYHLKTHTGTKNHKCPFCGKKFTANINLNAHIKSVHSEVKPHLCNICGKRYTTSDHLRKHMVYHTGERKFQCGVCGRDFTQNSHLTQHSWIHSGIKPYACKLCDNKYTSSSALKKHMQSNHTS